MKIEVKNKLIGQKWQKYGMKVASYRLVETSREEVLEVNLELG